MINNNTLQEVFIPPKNLEPRASLDGFILYGSDKVDELFLKGLEKSKMFKGSIKNIQRAVHEQKLLPCFFDKGFHSFIGWKIFSSKPKTVNFFNPKTRKDEIIKVDSRKAFHDILGFYSPLHKRVAIVLSNNVNIFSYVKNGKIGALTIHELIHLSSIEKKEKFRSLFIEPLIRYYKNMFSITFNLKPELVKDKEIQDIVHVLFKIENSTNKNSPHLKIYYKKLYELRKKSNFSEDKYDDVLSNYFLVIKIFQKNLALFFSQIKKYNNILGPLYIAYMESFGIRVNNITCVQELIYPSEVIAVLSEQRQILAVTSILNNI